MHVTELSALGGTLLHADLLRMAETAWPLRIIAQPSAVHSPKLAIEFGFKRAGGSKEELRNAFCIDDAQSVCGTTEKQFVVSFTDHPLLDPVLRGRSISHKAIGATSTLATAPGDAVLATANGEPIWVARDEAGRVIERVSIGPPTLAEKESYFDYLHGDNFIRLVPLFHFLKRAVVESGWRFPRPRACFMFDDPNLHWKTYGYVSYPELIRRGRASNYHVSFATVPFDGWYIHAPTAALFRENQEVLSLVMHGNNHVYAELARSRNADGHLAVAAQSMCRVDEIEKRSGVHICRVMAPPHGACSNAMMDAMLSVGIEAAFCSPWSLRLWDETHSWPPAFGLLPAELVGNGFAVPPRFRLSSSCIGSAVVSAFLGRPIVPVGHHHDLKEGPELLSTIAADINRIPGVEWMNPDAICRSNYLTCADDRASTIHIVPYSTHIRLVLPESASCFAIHAAKHAVASGRSAFLAKTDKEQWREVSSGEVNSASSKNSLSVKATTLGRVAASSVKTTRVPPTALARRVLCEARDRLSPAANALRSAFALNASRTGQ